VNPPEGFIDDVFTFDARGTTDPDAGDALSYRFAFGDGEQTAFTASATATHRYAVAGTYTIRLTARDDSNASTDLTSSVRVLEQGEQSPPIALIAIGPRTGAAPLTLTFDGRLSYDPDDDPMTYLWTFLLDGEVVDTSIDSMATRVFDEIGTYTVVLAVTDAGGAVGLSDPETVLVTERGTPIEPPPPLPRPTPVDPPPSYEQRPPQTCGIGMLMGFFGSLLGLSTMRGVRRKRTRA
jgi:PKD repeat protein